MQGTNVALQCHLESAAGRDAELTNSVHSPPAGWLKENGVVLDSDEFWLYKKVFDMRLRRPSIWNFHLELRIDKPSFEMIYSA